MKIPDKSNAVEPHPVMSDYYQERSERSPFVRRLFNETAPYYDQLSRIFSLGTGAFYRHHRLHYSGLRPGQRVLDVAIGTGLVAREALRITGKEGAVIGIDLSEAMLAEARRSLDIPLIQGRAEDLPLADESVDFVTMGYALRHVSDLAKTFREFHRVLRPNGTLLILEISPPKNPVTRAVASFYLGRFIPMICRLTTKQLRAATLLEYCWDTIENCVPLSVTMTAMRDSGFQQVGCHANIDLFRSITGKKL